MEKTIDDLDRKILRVITKNARIPFKELAEVCEVSRAAAHQRVYRLIELGVVNGSGYDVNPKWLGYDLCAYVGLILERGSLYSSVIEALQEIPEVVESQYVLGKYSIFIKVYARDNEHLMYLLNTKIQCIPGVITTETLVSLDQRIKRQVPIE